MLLYVLYDQFYTFLSTKFARKSLILKVDISINLLWLEYPDHEKKYKRVYFHFIKSKMFFFKLSEGSNDILN